MKGWSDPPLSQSVQENVVRGTTLIAMELVEEPMSWMELVWVLVWRHKNINSLIIGNLFCS